MLHHSQPTTPVENCSVWADGMFHIYIYTHTHTYTYMHAHTHMHTHTHNLNKTARQKDKHTKINTVLPRRLTDELSELVQTKSTYTSETSSAIPEMETSSMYVLVTHQC